MLVSMVKSSDPNKMIEATGRIRKLLSIGTPFCVMASSLCLLSLFLFAFISVIPWPCPALTMGDVNST